MTCTHVRASTGRGIACTRCGTTNKDLLARREREQEQTFSALRAKARARRDAEREALEAADPCAPSIEELAMEFEHRLVNG